MDRDPCHQATQLTWGVQGYLSGWQLLVPCLASQVPHDDQLSQTDKQGMLSDEYQVSGVADLGRGSAGGHDRLGGNQAECKAQGDGLDVQHKVLQQRL